MSPYRSSITEEINDSVYKIKTFVTNPGFSIPFLISVSCAFMASIHGEDFVKCIKLLISSFCSLVALGIMMKHTFFKI